MGVKVLSPCQAPQSGLGGGTSREPSFEGRQSWTAGIPQDWEKHTPLWEGTQKILCTRRPSESESEGTQSCLTLCDPMGCSLPGSSVHGIFQARVLEWGAIAFSRGSS